MPSSGLYLPIGQCIDIYSIYVCSILGSEYLGNSIQESDQGQCTMDGSFGRGSKCWWGVLGVQFGGVLGSQGRGEGVLRYYKKSGYPGAILCSKDSVTRILNLFHFSFCRFFFQNSYCCHCQKGKFGNY